MESRHGIRSRKTEHSGPKRGNGAYWDCKVDAKRESNRKRRTDDREAVQEQFKDRHRGRVPMERRRGPEGTDGGHPAPRRAAHSLVIQARSRPGRGGTCRCHALIADGWVDVEA